MDFFSSYCTITSDDSMTNNTFENEKLSLINTETFIPYKNLNQTRFDNIQPQIKFFQQNTCNDASDTKTVYQQQISQNNKYQDYKLYPQTQNMSNNDNRLLNNQSRKTIMCNQNSSFEDLHMYSSDQFHTKINQPNLNSSTINLVDNVKRNYTHIQDSQFNDQQTNFLNTNQKYNNTYPLSLNNDNEGEKQSNLYHQYADDDIQQTQGGFIQNSNYQQKIKFSHETSLNINPIISQNNEEIANIQQLQINQQHKHIISREENQNMGNNQKMLEICQFKPQLKKSDSKDYLSIQNVGSNLDLDCDDKEKINIGQNFDEISEFSKNNNKNNSSISYQNTNQNYIIQSNNNQKEQEIQQISNQTENLLQKEFSFINVSSQKQQDQSIEKSNKYQIDGGIIIDLNEFVNPEQKHDNLMDSLNEFYSFTSIQKFKKYVVCSVEQKNLPKTNISQILQLLEQYNQTNEKAVSLSTSLKEYKQFVDQRSIMYQEQNKQIKQTSEYTILSSTCTSNINLQQLSSFTNIPQLKLKQQSKQSQSSIVFDTENQTSLNQYQIDPYSSISRNQNNTRQTDKILKQFEKYCYSFRIIRKSPATIESLQMGVSNSLIELVGLNTTEAISNTLRNISTQVLPFDYNGLQPSEYAINSIFEISSSYKDKQRHYNRNQSLYYGELKHSSGKSIKIRVQSKVFLLNTYSSINESSINKQNNSFNEDLVGDYLEIKLITPESFDIQKNTKKRTSSQRKGIISEEECLQQDQNEKVTTYINNVQSLFDKFYSDESILSAENIFRKKWTVKRNQK